MQSVCISRDNFGTLFREEAPRGSLIRHRYRKRVYDWGNAAVEKKIIEGTQADPAQTIECDNCQINIVQDAKV
jgi:hypothetical protein